MHPQAWSGALLINKPAGISSFGVIEELQRKLTEQTGVKRRELPKLGHGGTLDPFATGLLIVCVGRAVKLARYFLGSAKGYEGVIRFGETTVPGDPTSPVSETSAVLPVSREAIQEQASKLCAQPYLQIPPMHSAKKKDGKPLYELARQGIEIERESKTCHLHSFEILDYANARANFRLSCSSGTYVRTLAQDLGRLMGTVAMLETLHRTSAGSFRASDALTLPEVGGNWDELSCWIPFDRLLEGYTRAEATLDEATALTQGRQNVLFNILRRAPASAPSEPDDCIAIYCANRLVAIARRDAEAWGLERVFTTDSASTGLAD